MLCFALLPACATLFGGGSSKNINIMTSDSSVVNAVITTKSGTQFTTIPKTLSVKKGMRDVVINVEESECVKQSTAIMDKNVDPLFWGNIITGGIYGSATDAITGKMWTYDDTIIVPIYKKDGCKTGN
ncbi:MAG: hypothetical protein LBS34_03190 [Rickettsiales bacterium]|nr:hypothetical protein [Rickettsiales bacterium]